MAWHVLGYRQRRSCNSSFIRWKTSRELWWRRRYDNVDTATARHIYSSIVNLHWSQCGLLLVNKSFPPPTKWKTNSLYHKYRMMVVSLKFIKLITLCCLETSTACRGLLMWCSGMPNFVQTKHDPEFPKMANHRLGTKKQAHTYWTPRSCCKKDVYVILF